MPSILHRLSIDASLEAIVELVASRDGIAQWWTSQPVSGEDGVGGRFAVYFGEHGGPAAVFEVIERSPLKVVWRCIDGPSDWRETTVAFAVRQGSDGGTTLLFSHRGWRWESEFMSGCSTNWGAYLMGLKSGAEGRGFNPYPGGEISRWD